jgi:hypothetical protein
LDVRLSEDIHDIDSATEDLNGSFELRGKRCYLTISAALASSHSALLRQLRLKPQQIQAAFHSFRFGDSSDPRHAVDATVSPTSHTTVNV